MKKENQDTAAAKNMLREALPVYESREALEEARLREAVNRTGTEKFRMFTTMMRINMMMKRAKIIHKPV